ncbi:MAG TPA: ABC transporter permease [Bacillales bacterium]|nr:ABC transporter permease [Bacillales bacterium]
MRYLINRLIFFVLSLWAAVTINFILPRLMPGNPAQAMFAKFQGQLKPEAMAAMKQQFGLTDEPIWDKYLSYLQGLVTGDWGLSFASFPVPVSSIIEHSIPWTIFLVGGATVISVFIGTALGIYVSFKRQGLLDSTLPISSMALQAMPHFFVAMVLIFVFAFQLGWFPLGKGFSIDVMPGFHWDFIKSALFHSILPGITLFFGGLSGWLIGMRNNMIYTLGEDYVVFAEAKGVRPTRLMFSYAARNAFLPQLTSFALAIGHVVSGAILVEVVFSYPGIGSQLNDAVLSQDYPMIQASFLLIAVAVLTANLIVDLLYARLDPRIRTGGADS